MNTPERWSTASSESDLSSIQYLGDVRFRRFRAKELQELLRQQIAFISGGIDRRGGRIITLPAHTFQGEQQDEESIGQIVSYLANLPSEDECRLGFSIILDMRSCTWSTAKPVLRSLQECFPEKIHSVYIIKPEGFWERHKTNLKTSKLSFETTLTSLDGLAKFIEPSQLTASLGGTLKYDHTDWLNMRLALEKFLYEAMALLSKLDEIQDGLSKDEFAETQDGLKDQIKKNHHVKKWIVKAPVEILQEEGERILKSIKNPTSEHLVDGFTIQDYKKAEQQVQELVESLILKRQRLRELWNIRKQKLDQCFQFRVFQIDAHKMLKWIKENREDFLINYSEIGNDTESAEELEEEHRNFESSCMNVYGNIHRVLEIADKLSEAGHYEADRIEALAESVDREWKSFDMEVNQRSSLLSCSVAYHKHSEEFLRNIKYWKQYLEDPDLIKNSNVSTVEIKIQELDKLRQEFEDSFHTVSTDSKALLGELQKPAVAFDDQFLKSPEYSEASSHVMDIYLEVHEHHRQLGILWEKQRTRLKDHLHLCMFDQDSKQVIRWIEEHGETFLKKHTGIGKSLVKAEALLKRHEEFENIAQNTYTNAAKLLEAARHLAQSGECNPEEIQKRVDYFEKRVQEFIGRVNRRKGLLKLAVNFYTRTQKLTELVEQLKSQLELEEVSDNPDNIATVLTNLKHQGEATLDSIHTAIDEGETIVEELKLASADGMDSSSLHHVEKVIKELDRVRRAIEHSWSRRRQQLELWLQLREFERAAKQLKDRLESCEELLERGVVAPDLPRAKQALTHHEDYVQDIENASLRTFCRGEELIDALKQSEIELRVKDPLTAENIDAQTHVHNLLEVLHRKRRDLRDLAEERKIKLEQNLLLRQLESDAKQVVGWVRNGEAMLYACTDLGSSLVEAEALLREHDEFQRAIEKTCQSATEVRQRAEKLIKDGHFEPETIRACADAMTNRWQHLMERSENRKVLITASFNFFNAGEAVGSLMDRLVREYKTEDGDPCSKLIETETTKKLEAMRAIVQSYDDDRESIVHGFSEVKYTADSYLNMITAREVHVDGSYDRAEQQVKDVMDVLKVQEQVVMDLWGVRKTMAEHCVQYLELETSAKEALDWIHENGEFYLSSHPNDGDTEAETRMFLKEHHEFKEAAEVQSLEIRDKVRTMLQQAESLVTKSCHHGDGIRQWATAVEKRYKDFSSRMSKYRVRLETKLGYPTIDQEDDNEWPSLHSLQPEPQDQPAFALRETSKDSGIHEMTEEKRRSAKRKEFIVNELLQTERAYVGDLKCVIENYVSAMENNPDVPAGLVGKESIIFGNIQDIYKFHSNTFLQEMEKYETHPEDVGEAFIEWGETFVRFYVSYCKNKPFSNSLLIEHGGNFFSDLQASYGHGLSISAYLIKPVQRITKYQLLLKDLLTCCEGSENSLQAGLDVMLSVPRRANDAMYVNMLHGLEENLDHLGRIILQDAFTVFDPKLLRRKGKDRHVFLFEQALVFSKETKDNDGKVSYLYKYKLKTSELGVTEHIAEDPCKFAVWTGKPPQSEDKRVIKAANIEVKQLWVKELRELIQQFQFGILKERSNSMMSGSTNSVNTTSSVKSREEKAADRESGVIEDDSVSGDYDVPEGGKVLELSQDNIWLVAENYRAATEEEISLRKGQFVEVLVKSHGSTRWRVRILNSDGTVPAEGWVPYATLRRPEDNRKKRHSDISHSSSEDSVSISSTESPTTSWYSTPPPNGNGGSSPPVRRRSKSNTQFGSLRMRSWSRNSMKKMMNKPGQAPSPTNTPARSKKISGGGSKKLQQMLGASESDIDLLLRPAEIVHTTSQTSIPEEDVVETESSDSKPHDAIKIFPVSDDEDEDDLDEMSVEGVRGEAEGEEQPVDDEEDATGPGLVPEDPEAVALKKRTFVLRELIQTEQDYVTSLGEVVDGYIAEFSKPDLPEELKGKERMVFGNIKQIYEWHKTVFCRELEKCEDAPEKLASVFLKAERRLQMYVIYCQNKPKSTALVHEFKETYFTDMKDRLGYRLSIEDYLIKPVQRVMKYQLLLKDFVKYTERAGLDIIELKRALHLMHVVPKKANDFLNVGMLEGYTGKITAQGNLVLQDTLMVMDVNAKAKPVKRRVFLFEQLVIFSEPFERKTDWTVYIYRHSIKTNHMGHTDGVDDDPCKLAIWTSEGTASEIYVLTASSEEMKNEWVSALKKLLESQNAFAMVTPPAIEQALNDWSKALERPIEYQNLMERQKNTPGDSPSQGAPPAVPVGPVTTQGQVTPGSSTTTSTSPAFMARAGTMPDSISVRRPPGMGSAPATPTGLGTISSIVKHMHLIDLETAKSLEELTSPFPSPSRNRDRYMVTEDFRGKDKNQLSVRKGEYVYLVSCKKDDKSWMYVCNGAADKLGLVPAKVLVKKSESNNNINEETESETTKTRSNEDKPRRGEVRKTKDEYFTSMSEKLRRSIERFRSEDDDQSPCGSPTKNFEEPLEDDGSITFTEPLQDIAVNNTEYTELTCKISSPDFPYKVSWAWNDTPLCDNDKYRISRTGDTHTLKLGPLAVADTGYYTCIASSPAGSARSTAKVTVLGVPEPPYKPYVKDLLSSSLVLAWEPNAIDGGNEVTAYTVEYKETGVSVWQAAVPFVAGESTLIDDLTPGATYQFRVSANNSIGISRPSEPFEVVMLETDTDDDVTPTSSPTHKSAVSWKNDIDQYYNIYAELGRGRYAVVKKCVEKSTGKEFAAKMVKKRMLDPVDIDREVTVLRMLKHPNLCIFLDAYDTPKNYIIVTELLAGGRLFDYLVVMDALTEKVAIGYMHQVVEGVQHLHDLNIVHLDLKPQNLLLDGGPLPKVKIIDFGSAHILSGSPVNHKVYGSPEFAAPELIMEEPLTFKTDTWSIGVITYVMLSGVSPFQADTTDEMCERIRKANFSFPNKHFSAISSQAKDFISSLLIADITKRADCQDCFKSDWIRMCSPRPPSPVRTTKLNTSRLAAFNARRRNQHDLKPLPRLTSSSSNSESNV
ncbi:triple functional domain protein isoform X5 [Nematostella vectensis]|uniref:triple functional domain protein isoform X5 n=1 Tax=Nematostella vectensis TaxID=45351 RepID=UPI002076F1C5|nr:triple functional domain protein isoform X5 [Nematostella vectensis]